MIQSGLCFVALVGVICCFLQEGAESGHLDRHDAQLQWLVRVSCFCTMFQATPLGQAAVRLRTRPGLEGKTSVFCGPDLGSYHEWALHGKFPLTARFAATLPAELLRRLSNCRDSLLKVYFVQGKHGRLRNTCRDMQRTTVSRTLLRTLAALATMVCTDQAP